MTTILTLFTILHGSTAYSQIDTPGCASKLDTITNRQIYTFVDSMPEFPGGLQAMFDFIAKNINDPKDCHAPSGTVFISFIVEPSGQLTNKRIIKGIAESVDKEILSIIDKMPNWLPGTCKGQPVPIEYKIPIRFGVP